MASTDCLQLNKTSMFAKVRAGLPVERLQTQNLLECKDDLLYCWDSKENCLLVLNWRAAVEKGFDEVKYQTLIPSVPLSFEVERVLTSNEASLIVLAGSRGVCILELPRRWGANGQFMEGKAKITCRASNLDGHFFTNNPHLELRQLRWHPASPTDSHLLVLLSDNTIRVYDNAALRHVWQVGPITLKTDVNPNSSTVYALGEAAVDFDIAPAVNTAEMQTNINNSTIREPQNLMNSTRLSQVNLNEAATANETASKITAAKAEKIEWPIVILRENGNIYVLMSGLDTERPRLQGPLTITPSTADNYGLDSCSLLVIPSLPPTLVIAETNGKLHHALFMEAENAEDSFNEVDENLIIHPSEWCVHVLETVELELGLPKEDIHQPYFCPIHLKRDFINELRYFAYHNTGLHVITVNFIAELQRFLENDVNSDINTLSTPSHAEYIVCTKIDTSENVNAVLGFVLMQMPSCAVLLLSSGQVISLKLVIDPKLLADCLTKPRDDNALTKNKDIQQTQLNQILGPSFIDHVKNILKRTVTQPILSLDKSANPSPQECYELLTQAVEVLRSQYLKRHEMVRAEFARRIHTIKLCKEQQKQDIEDLEHEREVIRDKAHKLAERFEEISDQQEVLTKRCQDLMRQANTCLPCNTLAEREFAQEVEKVNKITKNMVNSLQKSKEEINKQLYHISKYQENSKKKNFELPETQERTIKEILLQMTSEIDGQIKEVKRINKIVGI